MGWAVFSKVNAGWFHVSRVSVQTDLALSSTMNRMGRLWLKEYLIHSLAMPVSEVMSPMKQ